MFTRLRKLAGSHANFCMAHFETSSIGTTMLGEILQLKENSFTSPIAYVQSSYFYIAFRFMPYESYINAKLFGPELLAKEMVDIINDKQRYIDYFRWHRYYSLHDTDESPETDVWCIFCKYLNDNLKLNKTTVYPDLVRWYNEPRDWPPRILKQRSESNGFVKFFSDLFDYFSEI